jgi:hypothetical protein
LPVVARCAANTVGTPADPRNKLCLGPQARQHPLPRVIGYVPIVPRQFSANLIRQIQIRSTPMRTAQVRCVCVCTLSDQRQCRACQLSFGVRRRLLEDVEPRERERGDSLELLQRCCHPRAVALASSRPTCSGIALAFDTVPAAHVHITASSSTQVEFK